MLFLRSRHGTDPSNCLWLWHDGEETLLADPADLLADDEELPAAERARRERMREVTAGITAYSTDDSGTRIAFVLSGTPYLIGGSGEAAEALPAPGPVIDARIDPTGTRVAYVHEGSVWVATLDDAERLTAPDADDVTWGLADFIASEELERMRGMWWLADGSALLVERVDEHPVQTWWIADPARPAQEPIRHRYPQAGTANAEVSLWLVELDGARREIAWDHSALPYLVSVTVSSSGEPLVALMSRDQRRQVVLAVARDGATRIVSDRTDDAWIDVTTGVPAWDPQGRLLEVVADYARDTYVLLRDGAPISPPGWQVLGVGDIAADGIIIRGGPDSTREVAALLRADGSVHELPERAGVSSAHRRGDTVVSTWTDLTRMSSTTQVWRDERLIGEIASLAETPIVSPLVTRVAGAPVETVIVWPRERGAGLLPVIMSPYGGPHARVVLEAGVMYGTAAWLAESGYAVIIADGRGTPGRGPTWDRAVRDDLATPALEDQVAALDAALAAHPDDLDGSRVGIHGWSFGGFLAALAVLRRPDRFHAAVAGAPVTEWRLYDTAYTERYLGDPNTNAQAYDRSSLIPLAPALERPLLIVHGLADDNVVVAHTLELSSALLAAGRPHSVLPLTGVTHMTPQEIIAENLLRAELDFFDVHLKR